VTRDCAFVTALRRTLGFLVLAIRMRIAAPRTMVQVATLMRVTCFPERVRGSA
jgi:hypothetical protein